MNLNPINLSTLSFDPVISAPLGFSSASGPQDRLTLCPGTGLQFVEAKSQGRTRLEVDQKQLLLDAYAARLRASRPILRTTPIKRGAASVFHNLTWLTPGANARTPGAPYSSHVSVTRHSPSRRPATPARTHQQLVQPIHLRLAQTLEQVRHHVQHRSIQLRGQASSLRP